MFDEIGLCKSVVDSAGNMASLNISYKTNKYLGGGYD